MSCNHTIHARHHHTGWDRSIAPVLTVRPGETIAVETIDASGGQLDASSGLDDLKALDFGKVNPVTGPIHIEGAEPGDAVAITFKAFHPSGWGWTANIPGFGLLADEFPEAALNIWTYDRALGAPAAFGPGGQVPLKPFVGTIGLAPAEPGLHSVVPPRRVGGNLDVRDNAVGTTLYLPVEVAGGLLSLGDTHAAQGDGEICGTAIESPCEVEIAVDLVKDANFAFPRFETAGPVTRHLDAKGYWVTTGIGTDLMQAARDAVRGTIDRLTAETGLSAVEAYMLSSVCGDLRISEIVDQPNWVVSFYFPKIVLQ
ncbi:acetamidase/formamidase family protein [Oceanicola granulosus HTCC2516]|uniref:Acetamidase/formamidase family protein n=1 Tax=Oceanicola granulosus (strain ATCC BAA-861 / DSM 15982 / KCTC 12143 / HTCC2516) TaxID=314256 RepID=Q2CET9_OCEGH|nr:acetamidase/formamidase family protein [Oceanicola granulosus]EAR51169.1 acetamidase/formamidase family protein [Oceanicola granulosus HTCC2516]